MANELCQVFLFMGAMRLKVQSVACFEKLSMPFQASLTVIMQNPIVADDWLGKIATLQFVDGLHQKTLKKGVITQVMIGEITQDYKHKILFVLESRLSLLRRCQSPKVILNKSILTVFDDCLLRDGRYAVSEIFHHTALKHQTHAMLLQGFWENDWEFLQRICAEESCFIWEDVKGVHLCDHSSLCSLVDNHTYLFTPDVGEVFKVLEEVDYHDQLVKIFSRIPALKPGLMVSLDLTNAAFETEDRYFILEVKHYCRQGQDSPLAYWNEVLLLPCSRAYQVENRAAGALFPWCFEATIESEPSQAFLTKKGEYRLRFGFDASQKPHLKASKPLNRLSVYGGKASPAGATGLHFPLKQGALVLVNCIEGDPTRPIILGALPDEDHPSVVTAKNADQNILKTDVRQALIMDDASEKPQIRLQNHDSYLSLQQNDVKLQAESGQIQLFSHQGSCLQSDAAFHLKTAKGLSQIVKGHYQLTVAEQSCFLSVAKAMTFKAGESMRFSSKTMTHFTHGDYAIQAKRLIQFKAGLGGQVICAKKAVSLRGETILLQSSSKIQLSSADQTIVLLPNKILFYAGKVAFNSEALLMPKGRLHFYDSRRRFCARPRQAVIESVLPLSVPNLLDNSSIEDCHWSKAVAKINQEIQAICFVKDLKNVAKGQLLVYTDTHLFLAKKTFNVSEVMERQAFNPFGNVTLSIPWRVQQTHALAHQAYQHQERVSLYFKVKLGSLENHELSSRLNILTDLKVTLAYQGLLSLPDQSKISVIFPNHQLFGVMHQHQATVQNVLLGKITLSALEADVPHQLGFGLEEAQVFYRPLEVYQAKKSLPNANVAVYLKPNLKTQALALKCLIPPKICNLYDANIHRNQQKYPLTDAELKQIALISKNKPKNITLFIHGFNVELGDYGQHIEAVLQDGTPVLSGQSATIYRAKTWVKKQFPSIDLGKLEGLNGTGAYSWLLAMEYYINKACGFKQDYDQYTRMIGIFWEGCPQNAMDYMSVTQKLKSVGKKLLPLLLQLLQGGFEVTIIAHSLGNGVALHALNYLGQLGAANLKIKQYFMWQAAVPNTIFSGEGDQNSVWSVPHITAAVEKFIVLKSENDNVLGPIPKIQRSGYSQEYVNAQKPESTELVPAVIFTYLGLGSLYDAAMAIGLPISDLFLTGSPEIFYKAWHKRYPNAKDKQGRYFPETLQQYHKQVTQQDNEVVEHHIQAYLEKNRAKITHYLKRSSTMVNLALTAASNVTGIYKFLHDLPYSSLMLSGVENENSIYENPVFIWYENFMVLLNAIFYDSDIHYSPALGYAGIDKHDMVAQKLKQQGRLVEIDQTDCLFSHSGMKSPSKQLFEKIFKKAIWQDHPDFHFGGY